jgi:hypothetical protein
MKKEAFVVFIFIFMCSFVLAINNDSSQWHSSDIVLVEINGFNITLQDAINENYFGSVLPTQDSDYPFYSHLASEILVRTPRGHIMTLQEASDTDSFVISVEHGSTDNRTVHFADEINAYSKLGEIMTIQDLIDYGKMFCGVCNDFGYECGQWGDGCGGTIDCDAEIGGCGSGEYCNFGACTQAKWVTGDWDGDSCGTTANRDVWCESATEGTVSDSVCSDIGLVKPSSKRKISCTWEYQRRKCTGGCYTRYTRACDDSTLGWTKGMCAGGMKCFFSFNTKFYKCTKRRTLL